MLDSVLEYVKSCDVEIKENTNLSKISPVRIGGLASVVLYPKNTSGMIETIGYLSRNNIRYKIFGRLSNTLFCGERITRPLIKTDRLSSIQRQGEIVEAMAGVALPLLSLKAAEYGLSGLEELSGIPGTLGGAILGNAGAFGRSISDVIKTVTVYDTSTDSVATLDISELDFGYRASSLKYNGAVILSAELKLVSGDTSDIRERMHYYREIRRQTQPALPSLGSTFKRPACGYAGQLIEECGLRGYSMGGAEISSRHAGFIVNKGEATAADYIGLMYLAKKSVFESTGVVLEPEIEIIN